MPEPSEDEWQPRPRGEWGPSDYAVEALCLVVGCRSVVRPWRGWGYRIVCNPLCLWLLTRDERREAVRDA